MNFVYGDKLYGWNSHRVTYRKHTRFRGQGRSASPFRFRIDPVPGICNYSNGYWMRRKHAHIIGEMGDYKAHIEYSKEINQHYNTTFKVRRARANAFERMIGWDSRPNVSKGDGWKRSKKKRQWMNRWNKYMNWSYRRIE